MIAYETNYLAHHGILGMKWGVRRYQNKDGSLTAEGRRHVKKAKEADKKWEEVNRQGKKLFKDNKVLRDDFVSYDNVDDNDIIEIVARENGINTDAYWNSLTSYRQFVKENNKSISVGRKIIEKQKKKQQRINKAISGLKARAATLSEGHDVSIYYDKKIDRIVLEDKESGDRFHVRY